MAPTWRAHFLAFCPVPAGLHFCPMRSSLAIFLLTQSQHKQASLRKKNFTTDHQIYTKSRAGWRQLRENRRNPDPDRRERHTKKKWRNSRRPAAWQKSTQKPAAPHKPLPRLQRAVCLLTDDWMKERKLLNEKIGAGWLWWCGDVIGWPGWWILWGKCTLLSKLTQISINRLNTREA